MLTALAKTRNENVTSLGAETIHPFLAGANNKEYEHACTYWDYIHPEKLCALQTGREGKGLNHHEEHLFIIVHQVFELWFKQILHDLDFTIATLANESARRDELHVATHRLKRAHATLRMSLTGFAMMETMDPVDFLEFRDYLSPASGFQSAQMRILEIRFGIKEAERKCEFIGDYRDAFISKLADKTVLLDSAEEEPTLKDTLMAWLSRVDLPHLDTFVEAFLAAKAQQSDHQIRELEEAISGLEDIPALDVDEKLLKQMLRKEKRDLQVRMEAAREQATSVVSFYNDPELGRARQAATFLLTFRHFAGYIDLADTVQHALDFEQGFALWRARHARMVERMIGRRTGTGGSSGMDYLDDTTKYRVFQDLSYIRSISLPASLFPDVVSLFQ